MNRLNYIPILLVLLIEVTLGKVLLDAKLEGIGNVVQKQKKVYITLVEGTYEIYKLCDVICTVDGKRTSYAEVTTFPEYGKIFRCQCGKQFSSWYNVNTLDNLGKDILRGDEVFNYYLNMLSLDLEECECESLKNVLLRLIA